jgi:chorismate mutase
VLKGRSSDTEFRLPRPHDDNCGNPALIGFYSSVHYSELKKLKGVRSVEVPAKEYCRMKHGPNDKSADRFGDHEVVITSAPWPEKRARIDELIEGLESWDKARNGIEREVKLEEADRELGRLVTKRNEILDAIAAINARTMEGLRVKARAVKIIYDKDEVEFGDTTDEVLAASLINDPLAIAA